MRLSMDNVEHRARAVLLPLQRSGERALRHRSCVRRQLAAIVQFEAAAAADEREHHPIHERLPEFLHGIEDQPRRLPAARVQQANRGIEAGVLDGRSRAQVQGPIAEVQQLVDDVRRAPPPTSGECHV